MPDSHARPRKRRRPVKTGRNRAGGAIAGGLGCVPHPLVEVAVGVSKRETRTAHELAAKAPGLGEFPGQLGIVELG